MIIKRKSILTGNINEMPMQVTTEQVERFCLTGNVVDAFPNLPPVAREFLMTGITPTERYALFYRVQ